MLGTLISRLPASWIRAIGSLQFRVPVIGPLIGFVGRRVLATSGVIRHGVGTGLRFDAAGSSPGFLFGTSDPDEQAVLVRFLKRGAVCYDIGANVGFFAVLAARLVGPTGRVYAFEPFPNSAAAVRRNAALNNFTHLEVIEAAVAAAPGEASLQIGSVSGTNSIVFDRTEGELKVKLVSIDSFVQEPCRSLPDFVMIDAEGAEIDVLKGMAATIRARRPVILCEVHWIGAAFQDYCQEHIVPLGYSIRPLVGDAFPTEPRRFHALLQPSIEINDRPAV